MQISSSTVKSQVGLDFPEKNHKRILVVKLYAIGDFIMSLPSLELLRKLRPSAEIHLLTGKITSQLAKCSAPVDGIISVDEKILTDPGKRMSLFSLAVRLRKQRFDEVYLLHRVFPLRLLTLATGASRRTGQGNRKFGLTKIVPFETGVIEHDAERYARLFGWNGSEPLPEPRIDLPEGIVNGPVASLINPGTVAVSPGGGRSSIRNTNRKRWPQERFSRLIALLHKEGIRTVLLGSREDGEVLNNLSDSLPDSTTNLIGKTSILEAAAVLAECRLQITNDSSLMHIAGLVSTPTLTLFGPTDPLRIGVYPPDRLHRSLVSNAVECSPCHPDRGIDECDDARCMTSLNLERVWRETTEMLEMMEE